MKIYKLTYLIFCALALVSCDKYEDPEASRITYLPKIVLNGPDSETLECTATSYEDPGATASISGQPVDVTATVIPLYFDSDVINTPDFYVISYSAYNTDSIPGAATRSVFLPPCNGDLVTDISGVYTATVTENGVGGDAFTDMAYILIKKTGDNTFAISDALAGWYDIGQAYGSDYATKGMVITANDIAAGDFTSNTVDFFGAGITLTSMSTDPSSHTIHLVTFWDFGYEYDIVMTQVN